MRHLLATAGKGYVRIRRHHPPTNEARMQTPLRRAAGLVLLVLTAGSTPACRAPGHAGAEIARASSTAGADEGAIREIVANETRAWNQGDAAAYSRDFAEDGLFTNILGMSFVGHEAFVRQHDVIFRGLFRNTTLQQDIEALTFPRPDVALVTVLTAVSGLPQMPPGAAPDEKGRLRTRLLQVVVKEAGEWKVVAYHNVDVKRGTAVPEPRRD